MKNFEIKYEYTGYNNELKSLIVDDVEYTLDQLTLESKELLTIMTYEDYQCNIKYFDGIAQIIGYDTTLQGILDLQKLGIYIATASIYRMLVMNSYKNKYKGLMR